MRHKKIEIDDHGFQLELDKASEFLKNSDQKSLELYNNP